MGLLFTLAIVVAIVVVVAKRWRRTRALRVTEDERPRMVVSHAEIGEHMRCSCGGKRVVEGEGPKGDLWRVITRCGSCGLRRALLFQIAN